MVDDPRARIRLVVLLLASSLTVMAGALIAPALPGISRAFAHTPGVALFSRLLLTLPALSIAVAAPVAGLVLDRWGRRRVLVFGLVAYALTGTSAVLFDSISLILATRVGLGIAVAMVMTSASTLITDEFAGAARMRVMSLQGASMGFGSFIFLMAGGRLSDFHWRAPFLVYAVALLLVVPALLLFPKGKPSPSAELRTETSAFTWRSLLPLFGAGFVGMMLFYLIPTQLPFLLSDHLQRSGLDIGLAVGGATVVSSLSSLSSPLILRRLGRPRTLAAAFATMSLGMALLAEADTYGRVLSATVCFGAGAGFVMPTLAAWVGDLAPLELRGRAMGLLTTAFFLGQFLSPIAAGPILLSRGLQGSGGVFSAGAVLAACAGVLAIAVARRRAATTAIETDRRFPGGESG